MLEWNYKSFLNRFYAYSFFSHFAFIYAVYTILFRLRGLSVFEISLLLALWSAPIVLLEVPTGALADKWNRKHMLSVGMLFKAIGFSVWVFSNNFWMFALGFLFWALEETFTSGTKQALLNDTLKSFNKKEEYEKITGKAKFYENIAIGTSVFLGGFVASISFNLVLILTIISMLSAFFLTLTLKEIKKGKTSTKETKYFKLILNALKQSKKNKKILRMMIYSMIVLSVIGSLDEYDQLYYNWAGLPIMFFGIAGVSSFILSAVGGMIAYKIIKLKIESIIYVLSTASGLCLLISITNPGIIMIPIYLMIYFFATISEVLAEGRLQKEIKTNERATILSINNLLLNTSAIILVILFGTLSIFGGLYLGFMIFALIMITYSIIPLIIRLIIKIKKNFF